MVAQRGYKIGMLLKVTLEASNRSETMRNRKYAKFRIFTVVKKYILAHLTKKLDHFEKNIFEKF